MVQCAVCDGQTFFFNDDGSVTECVCRANTVMEKKLPNLYTSPETWVESKILQDAWRTRNSILYRMKQGFYHFRHEAGHTLAQVIFEGKRCRLFDGLKLGSIYFSKDPEFDSSSDFYAHLSENVDLALVLIGFSDPNINNKHIIGDLIANMLTHCKMHNIIFWALLNISMDEVQKHYGEQLYPFLKSMKYKSL